VPKVLVVDDAPDIVRLVRDYLEHAGFSVLVASNGVDALRIARSERPDLIVLDLGLPGRDGLDVTRELRRDSAVSTVPIVMLTARADESDKLVGLELGADDYVTKPFTPRSWWRGFARFCAGRRLSRYRLNRWWWATSRLTSRGWPCRWVPSRST
jgi:two-component system, OmpR family, alkaline phosphatase synthesis response regulator PhoP